MGDQIADRKGGGLTYPEPLNQALYETKRMVVPILRKPALRTNHCFPDRSIVRENGVFFPVDSTLQLIQAECDLSDLRPVSVGTLNYDWNLLAAEEDA
jgi:hypothetical protein